MPAKVRVVRHKQEDWVSVEDLRAAMNDEERILEAAAMYKVAREEHNETPLGSLRRAIAHFFLQSTGLLSHKDN